MRILVTGGAGFIGSHIVEHFQGKAEVRVIDSLRTGFKKNLDAFDVEFIEADILDNNALTRAMDGVDYVFHLAAMVSVPESMANPAECVEVNAKGTLAVLEAASKAGVKKLCMSSTCAIYGENPESPKVETILPAPLSPYAVTKLDGEFYCDIFAKTGKLKTVALRYFNVFGPRQDPNGAYAAAIPIFTSKAVNNETLTVYGDGEQTRDFIYVKDVVAANVYMVQSENEGVYNLGYGNATTVNDLISMIKDATKAELKVEYVDERPGDIKHSLGCIDKIVDAGFKPSSDFNKGLEETVKFFMDK